MKKGNYFRFLGFIEAPKRPDTKYLMRLLKMKSLYAVLLVIYFINSAMTYNRQYHRQQLEDYYGIAEKDSVIVQDSVDLPEEQARVEELSQEMRDEVMDLLTFARSQLNKPYAYAGKGPDKFDCSGFTGYVFREFDISLPASSQLQANVGVPVEKEDLKPGDLVFFKSPTPGVNRIGHVGIVINVLEDGVEFIHSSSYRGVVINDLIKSKHYSARYMGARRIL